MSHQPPHLYGDTPVNTYRARKFKDRFLQSAPETAHLFKPQFEQFFCLQIEAVPNFSNLLLPPTRELAHSLVFLTAGRYTAKIGLDEFSIGPNQLLTIPAGQVYSVEQIPEGLCGFSLHFHNDFLAGPFHRKEAQTAFEFLKLWSDPILDIPETEDGFLRDLLPHLYREFRENGLARADLLRSYLLSILYELRYLHLNKPQPELNAAARLTNRFKGLIFSQLKEKQRVQEFAEMLSVSPNHLNKAVRTTTGISPSVWIDRACIMEAKYLLYQTQMSISDIALEVGHTDQSYFSRMFKKYTGSTPSHYRQSPESILA
ncbi:MAG: helix-turn-helix domain-containing protein [Salibacteraceae bacterium]